MKRILFLTLLFAACSPVLEMAPVKYSYTVSKLGATTVTGFWAGSYAPYSVYVSDQNGKMHFNQIIGSINFTVYTVTPPFNMRVEDKVGHISFSYVK